MVTSVEKSRNVLLGRRRAIYFQYPRHYITTVGDTCDTISEAFNVSSAALFRLNRNDTVALNCSSLALQTTVCIPLPCGSVYKLQVNDTCDSIETAFHLNTGTVRNLNSWIQYGCFNLQVTNAIYGNVICLSAQGGTFVPPSSTPTNSTTDPGTSDGYIELKTPPPKGSVIAPGTTLNCGLWYTASAGDTCASIAVENGIPANFLWLVNPSLPPTSSCTASIVTNGTYCVGPTYYWNETMVTTYAPTSTSALPTAVPTSTKYIPLSCYSEPTTLDGTSTTNYANTTLELCASFCGDRFPFFGVEAAGFCYCSINPGAGYAPANTSSCDRACPGNVTEDCGGESFLNMFSVKGVATATSSSSVRSLSGTQVPSTSVSTSNSITLSSRSSSSSGPISSSVATFSSVSSTSKGPTTSTTASSSILSSSSIATSSSIVSASKSLSTSKATSSSVLSSSSLATSSSIISSSQSSSFSIVPSSSTVSLSSFTI